MRILILHDAVPPGARKDEQDALVQADVVRAALGSLGHDTDTLGLTLDLAAAAAAIRSVAPDLVFNLVESIAGTGRLIHLAPALLDTLGIPYTGAPTDAVYETSSKLCTKRVLRSAGLPAPAGFSLGQLRSGVAVPPGRYIIKSVWEHASIGLDEDSVVTVEDGAELLTHVEARLGALLGEGYAEAYIDGREFNLSLLAEPPRSPAAARSLRESDVRNRHRVPPRGPIWELARANPGRGCLVLPPAEIRFRGYGDDKPRVVGYRAKWEEGTFEYRNTPRRFEFDAADAEPLVELRLLARACWNVFGLRGYARVDLRVDKGGRPWILEVNTNPCLSPDAGFAAALERAGITLAEAAARIVGDAGCRGA